MTQFGHVCCTPAELLPGTPGQGAHREGMLPDGGASSTGAVFAPLYRSERPGG